MMNKQQLLGWFDEYGDKAPLKMRMMIPIFRGVIEGMPDEDFDKYVTLLRKILCPDCPLMKKEEVHDE
jgi:uncharacterized short protein YbdD (DUF466 family)